MPVRNRLPQTVQEKNLLICGGPEASVLWSYRKQTDQNCSSESWQEKAGLNIKTYELQNLQNQCSKHCQRKELQINSDLN